MVQAFDRLVMGRVAISLAAGTLLAGCQGFGPAGDPAGAGPAPAACPYLTEAEAWVNHMPGIGRSSAKLIVSLRVAGEDAWMLKPAGSSDGELVLEVAMGGNSVPGTVGYRQDPPSPLPDAIRIMCAGEELARIDEILIVQ